MLLTCIVIITDSLLIIVEIPEEYIRYLARNYSLEVYINNYFASSSIFIGGSQIKCINILLIYEE